MQILLPLSHQRGPSNLFSFSILTKNYSVEVKNLVKSNLVKGYRYDNRALKLPMLGETDRNHPPWPGTIVTMCVRYFMTGGPTKEHGTIFFFLELLIISYHQPEKLRKGQRRCRVSYYLLESFFLESILFEQCVCHQEGLLSQRQPAN